MHGANRGTMRSFVIVLGCVLVIAPALAHEMRFQLVERVPSAQLRERMVSLFNRSKTITVKHLRNFHWWREQTTIEAVEQRWKYRFTYRCDSNCGIGHYELKERLMTGRRIVGDCPTPWSAIFEFGDEKGRVVDRIYMQQSGLCFKFGNSSYYVERKHSLDVLIGDLEKVLWEE